MSDERVFRFTIDTTLIAVSLVGPALTSDELPLALAFLDLVKRSLSEPAPEEPSRD